MRLGRDVVIEQARFKGLQIGFAEQIGVALKGYASIDVEYRQYAADAAAGLVAERA